MSRKLNLTLSKNSSENCPSHLITTQAPSKDLDDSNSRIPFSPYFTTLNSPLEKFPASKKLIPQKTRSSSHLSPQSMQLIRCRLVGFTPLNEATITSTQSNSSQFLGPPQVKAKEVAPCALLYKRADVFVSSEMESHNVWSYCKEYYNQLCNENQVSIKQLEYADEPFHSSPQVSPSISFGNNSIQCDSHQVQLKNLTPKPLMPAKKPTSSLFAINTFTTIPQSSYTENLASSTSNLLDLSFEELHGDPTWDTRLEALIASPNRSGLNPCSSGLYSSQWSPTSSSSQGTSSVASLYINAPTSCHQTALSTSRLNSAPLI